MTPASPSPVVRVLSSLLSPRWKRLRKAFSATLAVCVALVALTAHRLHSQAGGTFTVINLTDSTSGSTTAGSLRDGINAANSGACASPCTINFAVAGTINIFTTLSVTSTAANGLTVNGFTAPGAATNTAPFGDPISGGPTVEVTSSSGINGFDISSPNVTIQGLGLRGHSTAVALRGINGRVRGSFIGTNLAGTAAGSPSNSTGVWIFSSGAIVGGPNPADRNLISGNSNIGVNFAANATGGNTIEGNYIGVDRNATVALANTNSGISVHGTSGPPNIVRMNVVSGNGLYGIHANTLPLNGISIVGNRVGTNGLGTAAIRNVSGGIVINQAPGAAVGGPTPSDGNLVSGNAGLGDGITIGTSDGATVHNNKIGTNLAGTARLDNRNGLIITNSANVVIGSSSSGNLIAGNGGSGIYLGGILTTNAQIIGNKVGTTSTSLGNNAYGILIEDSSNNRIANNVEIAYNQAGGIEVDDGTANEIIGNPIHTNDVTPGAVGIDLVSVTGTMGPVLDGPTSNDFGDGDVGAGNNIQNFPEIYRAYADGPTTSANVTVLFTLDSAPSTLSNRVEIFEADGSTNPQGRRLLHSQCYAGQDIFSGSIVIASAGLTVTASRVLATATSYADTTCGSRGDGTSEFSFPAVVVGTQPGVVVNENDSGPGSLRQAMEDASSGVCPSPCSIIFNIPAGLREPDGTYTIAVTSAPLPIIDVSGTVIDGATQTAFTGDSNPAGPEIIVNGSALTSPTRNGFEIVSTLAAFMASTVTPSIANVRISNLVINGFQTNSILVRGSDITTATTISSNYLGTNATGTAVVAPAPTHNIELQNAATTTIYNNLISGAAYAGIVFGPGTTNSVVTANKIGTNAAGTGAVPNNHGMEFRTTTSNRIGGTAAGEGNIIAFNSQIGIRAVDSMAKLNSIRGNSIHSNGSLGIDWGGGGPDVNDPQDPDTGPNDFQNYPVISTVVYNAATNQTTVTGTLNSLPSTAFDIDWYSNTAADPTGYGEGRTYEGTSTFTTDASGNTPVSIVLAGDKRSARLTATASRVSGADRETSEFSLAVSNTPPTANNDAYAGTEDTPLTVPAPGVLTNDTDLETPTSLTATVVTPPASGTLVLNADGSFTYTPASNVNGPITFTYQASDGISNSNPATVTITLAAVNDPPVANPDTYAMTEDTVLTTTAATGVLANDTDPDGGTLTATRISGPSNGTLVFNSDGSFTYTPNANFSGTDSFTYSASDGLASSSSTASITVNPVNDPPTAVNDTLSVNEDSSNSVNVLANDTDPETPGSLTVTGNSTAARGTVSCTAAGVCTYTANPNATGADSFTYTVSDGTLSSTGTVSVNIVAVNDPPVAANDSYSTPEDTALTVPAPGVLGNDSDVDGDPLTAVLASGPSTGTLTLNPNGSFTYTPASNFTGAVTFTYRASDGTATSSPATVTINVGGINDPPVAANDAYSTNEDTTLTVAAPGVLSNDSDPDGDTLTAALVSGPSTGTLTLNPNGSFTYTPASNFTGAVTFTYRASDGTATSSPATVTINVGGINDPPVAANDAYNTNEDTTLTVAAPGVLSNDSDPDGDTLTAALVTGPAQGTLTLNPSGAFTYTPNANYNGSDSFTYRANDASATSNVATVTITINPVNDAPVANPDTASATAGLPVTTNVTANDTDADGNALTVISFTQGSKGTVSCSGTNCTYTPNASASGTDSYTYTVSDGAGGTATGNVSVTITPVNTQPPPRPNAAPIANDDNAESQGGPVTINVLANDLDPDGDPIRFVSNTPATGGSVTCTPQGQCTFTPSPGFSGVATFGYTISDIRGASAGATVRIRVINCAVQPPTINPAGGSVSTPQTFSWTPVAGAVNYTVVVTDSAGRRQEFTVTGTSITLTLPNGAATWSVTANGVPGCGPLTTTANFTVCNIPVAPVAQVVGESTTEQTYTLSWDAVEGADGGYEVDEISAGVTRTVTVTGTSIDFTKSVTEPTAFFYRVRAISRCAQRAGPSSIEVRVVVVPRPPATDPTTNDTNIPFERRKSVDLPVFVAGLPGGTFPFTARTDRDWMSVRPTSGLIPPEGITLTVTIDPTRLPNGTFTSTLIVEITTPTLSFGRPVSMAVVPKPIPVSVTLVTPVRPSQPSEPPADALIIPAVGHLESGQGRWRSDIRIFNATSTATRYLLTFHSADPSIGTKTTNVDVAPGDTTALDDIVRNWYGIGSLGENSSGLLDIRKVSGSGTPVSSSKATVVSSRTYNIKSNGTTLGQFIPGVSFGNFIGTVAGGAALQPVLSLQQLAQNAQYRTNVGIVEGSGKSATVLVSVFNSNGDLLKEITYDLRGAEQKQIGSLLAQHGITADDARVQVRVIGGEGKVTAYASVVDNASLDQQFVRGVALRQSTSSSYVMPGVADLDTPTANWRSDLRIFNSGDSAQTATLTFYPQNLSNAPLSATVTINPGEVEVLNNIIKSTFGASNLAGAVHVKTAQASNLVVTGRTYNQTEAGTLGQFIEAVKPEEAVGAGQQALQILQVEDSVRYRTNIGMAETTGSAATVEMTVTLPDSLASARIEIPLAGNEFRQIPMSSLGLASIYNARVAIRVIDGAGRVTAYGSLIDMNTQDSTYIPAQ